MLRGDKMLKNRNVRIIVGVACILVVGLLYWFRPWIYLMPAPGPAIVEPGPEEIQSIVFDGDPQTPVKIRIGKINVEAAIIPVTTDKQGNMATTREPFGVTWYKNGASPGWPGNAILAGHNIYNGTPGSFASLHTLAPDDEVGIEYADGSTGKFLVKSIETYLLKDIPLSTMALTGDTRVTIITCAGQNVPALGGFSHRVIVLLDPIEQRQKEDLEKTGAPAETP